MKSTPRPLVVWVALVAVGGGACGGSDDGSASVATGAQPASPTASAPARPGDLAWRARSGGPSLEDHVVARARRRAASPWIPPDREAAASLADLTYGQLRALRFREDATLWRGQAPFELQLFHPGGTFLTPVALFLVDGGEARPLPFDPRFFDPGDELEGVDLSLPDEAGYPGFRLLYPLNDRDRVDEVIVFLGASYFRLLGPGQVYGLSARGVGVEVAGADGEEFPDFRAFWIERPSPGDTTLVAHALLDGPLLTGAFRFELAPGRPGGPETDPRGTVLDVDARFFGREDVGRLGIAPLTSMYLHGTFRPGGDDDVRPRVHDSEGLLMETSKGEWVWRPLTNRRSLQVTALRDRAPRGFGLVQRTRAFDRYLDLEAEYHRRPSLWVEFGPGDWGDGGVELVEFPTRTEFADNIVAYWAPDGGLPAGEERRFRYRLRTFDAVLPGRDTPRVVRSAIGRAALPGVDDSAPARRVLVDFRGGALADTPPARLEPRASTLHGEIDDLRVEALPDGGRRVTFVLRPDGDRPADLRVFLEGEGLRSETWSYLWRPDDPA